MHNTSKKDEIILYLILRSIDHVCQFIIIITNSFTFIIFCLTSWNPSQTNYPLLKGSPFYRISKTFGNIIANMVDLFRTI